MTQKIKKLTAGKSLLYGTTLVAGLTVAVATGAQAKAATQTGVLSNAAVTETMAAATSATSSSVGNLSSAAATVSSTANDVSSAQILVSSETSLLSAAQASSSAASVNASSTASLYSSAAATSTAASSALTSLSKEETSLNSALLANVVADHNMSSAGYFPSTTFTSSATVVLPAPSSAFVPDVTQINSYFLGYVNELRSLNGQPALTYSASEQAFAQTRAQEIETDFSHDQANGSTEDIAVNGDVVDQMLSNQEIAYYMVMDWTDESDNPEPVGNDHYGHLANLLYGGPTEGVGFIETPTTVTLDGQSGFDVFEAFEAPEYTNETLYNEAMSMANATTKPAIAVLPNTTFLYVNATSYSSLEAQYTSAEAAASSLSSIASSAATIMSTAAASLSAAKTQQSLASSAVASAEAQLTADNSLLSAATSAHSSAVSAFNSLSAAASSASSTSNSSSVANSSSTASSAAASAVLGTTDAYIYTTQAYHPNLNFITGTNAEGATLSAASNGMTYGILTNTGKAASLNQAGTYTVVFSYTDSATGTITTSSATLHVLEDNTSISLMP